jgi:hypothetical protein
MAPSKRSGNPEVEPDTVVSSVLGKEHNPIGHVICIGGFVGESPRTNHIRLFTKIDFSECLDIPKDAIVGHEKIERTGIPGGTYVWIKRDANVALTVVDPMVQLSTFLQGPILRSSSATTTMRRGGVGAGGFFSTPICTIIVSIATVTFIICSRVTCPDPTTDNCPEPDPIPEPESIIV